MINIAFIKNHIVNGNVYHSLTESYRIPGIKTPRHRYIQYLGSASSSVQIPKFSPMRPKETKVIPKGKQWIVEEKKDGSLSIMVATKNNIEYFNRRWKRKTPIYPELTDDEKIKTKGLTLIQGEVYALKGGKDSFDSFLKRDLLQDPEKAKKRMKKYPLRFEAFDIIMKNGKSLTSLSLKKRKKILKDTIIPTKELKVMPFFYNVKKKTKQLKKDKTVEGVVFKDITSKYEEGKSDKWRKMKFKKMADVTIFGYEKGKGKRKSIGVLKVGVWDKKKKRIREVANVGTGFTDKELKDIKKKLDKGKKLFARVEYLNLGSQGRLRAPSYKGLRTDITLKETHI